MRLRLSLDFSSIAKVLYNWFFPCLILSGAVFLFCFCLVFLLSHHLFISVYSYTHSNLASTSATPLTGLSNVIKDSSATWANGLLTNDLLAALTTAWAWPEPGQTSFPGLLSLPSLLFPSLASPVLLFPCSCFLPPAVRAQPFFTLSRPPPHLTHTSLWGTRLWDPRA